jgi:hypothetical protein
VDHGGLVAGVGESQQQAGRQGVRDLVGPTGGIKNLEDCVMTTVQVPRIVQSPLSKGRWFVVTRYRETLGLNPKTGQQHVYMVATEKFDVTDQMKTILLAYARTQQSHKRGRSQRPTPGKRSTRA